MLPAISEYHDDDVTDTPDRHTRLSRYLTQRYSPDPFTPLHVQNVHNQCMSMYLPRARLAHIQRDASLRHASRIGSGQSRHKHSPHWIAQLARQRAAEHQAQAAATKAGEVLGSPEKVRASSALIPFQTSPVRRLGSELKKLLKRQLPRKHLRQRLQTTHPMKLLMSQVTIPHN